MMGLGVRPRWIALSATGAALGLMAFAVFADPDIRLVWNGSASVPRGLYGIEDRAPKRGELVLARAPESALRVAISRGYLPSDMPVVKHLVAVEGDEICRFGTEISINGTVVATAQIRDLEGRLVPSWRGCERLDDGEVFLLADHPHSFDGRYWGKSDGADIHGVAHPVWTFGDSASRVSREEDAG